MVGLIATQQTNTQPKPDFNQANFDSNMTSEAPSLGKDANIVATYAKSAKYRSYKLLGFAQHLLIERNVKSSRSGNIHRTRLCHAARAGHVDTITVKISSNESDSSASLSGVQTCGSVWSCPVCARRIAVQRGFEIGHTIDYMVENGHIPLLLSLTARHDLSTRLPDFKDRFKKAWRYFSQSRKWRKLKARFGIEHSIKATEVTRTFENGWHYHQHGLLFAKAKFLNWISEDEMSGWIDELKKHWLHCLDKAGLDGSYDHALDVKASKDIKRDYLAKLGIEETKTGNLNLEMSGSGNKDYSGRNIWGILRSASEGDDDDAKHYIEYVETMSGTNWITYSRGLKDLVGLDEVADQDASEDENNESMAYEPLVDVSDYEYVAVRAFKAYGDLLEVAAESRDKDVVIQWLDDLRKTYNRTEIHNVREKQLEQYNSLDIWLKQYRESFNKRRTSENPSDEYLEKARKWKELRAVLHIKN